MVLDAIVEDPELVWLGTAEDKAANLTTLTSIEPEDLPHATTGEGDARKVRYFPDRLPIGIHLAGRGVLVYVVTDPTWTTSGCSSNVTPRCSGPCRPGRSASSYLRSSRHRRARQEGRGTSC